MNKNTFKFVVKRMFQGVSVLLVCMIVTPMFFSEQIGEYYINILSFVFAFLGFMFMFLGLVLLLLNTKEPETLEEEARDKELLGLVSNSKTINPKSAVSLGVPFVFILFAIFIFQAGIVDWIISYFDLEGTDFSATIILGTACASIGIFIGLLYWSKKKK